MARAIEKCGNCAFWRAPKGDLGRCQRRSPIGLSPMVDAYGDVVVDIWPRTTSTDFCGDFELKDAE